MEEYLDRLEEMDHTNDIPVIQEVCCRLLEFFFLLAQTKLKIRDLRTARTGPFGPGPIDLEPMDP